MKLLIVIVTALFLSPAFATDIYRCGNTFTDTPCGKKILVFNDTPTHEDRASAFVRYYESKLYLQAREYQQREFELTKAYIQSPRITQTTNVTATSSSSSSSSSSSDASAPTRFIINSAP